MALDEQAAGATTGIADGHAWLRFDEPGQHGDLARGVELAGALAAIFGEPAQEILVAAAEHVGFHIVQVQAVRGGTSTRRARYL